jgi:DHA2 family multidrug resistance protein
LTASPSAPHRGLITVSIMLATVMQVLDMTIANVALPHMQGNLSATQEQIAWVLTSYIVAAAIMTPPTGYLAARFGRKRLFAVIVVGFTLSSMLCGAATSLYELVGFRFLQGMFGAGLVPLSQATLLDTYPRERHGSAMALWGIGVMVGPILGPTLGGYLTEYYSWRWIFYINVPFGMMALAGILAFLPESSHEKGRPFDVFGFALLSIAIASLQLMLDRGQSQDWFSAVEIMLEAAAAGLFLYLFLVHMFTARHPFLEPGLFKDRNFAVGLLIMFTISIILLSTMTLLPPFLQNLMGYPVITTGFVLAPRGMGTMTAMFLVGALSTRVDGRLMVLAGLGLTALSLWQMSGFNLSVSTWTIIYTGIIQGIGLGLVFVPLSTITFSTLAPHYRNEGTAMFSLMRNLGSSIGVSIMVTLLARATQVNHSVLAANLTPFNQALSSGNWQLDSARSMAALNGEVTRQAAAIAYLDDFRLMMVIILLVIPLLTLLRNPRKVWSEQDRQTAYATAGE